MLKQNDKAVIKNGALVNDFNGNPLFSNTGIEIKNGAIATIYNHCTEVGYYIVSVTLNDYINLNVRVHETNLIKVSNTESGNNEE